MRTLFSILLLSVAALAQSSTGSRNQSGALQEGQPQSAQAVFYGFAALPINYVDSGYQCTPPNGVYDVEVTLGTQTIAALQTAVDLWQAAGDEWRRIKIPHGWNLHGGTFTSYVPDGTNKLMVFNPKVGATKCLVIESDTPLLPDVIPCSHGMPLPGQGTRNPGCANDLPSMWTFQADSTPASGNSGMYFPPGSNHILIRDVEITIAKGAFQSVQGVNVVIPIDVHGDHIGFERFYMHGWDPGDIGQPGAGAAWSSGTTYASGARVSFGVEGYISKQSSNTNHQPDTSPTFWDVDSVDSLGRAHAWKMTGTVNTSGQTITWASGKRFGMSFADVSHSPGYPQATITIGGDASGNCVGGTNYLITQHDPALSDTVLTVNNSAGTQTAANFCMTNPATAFAHGAGDDHRGIQLNCDSCWLTYGYSEKNHWANNESHVISSGFSNGPIKLAHLYLEGSSAVYFSGGGPVDVRGGPANDLEIAANYFGRDLAYRFLECNAGKSPHPPFGCGPLDNNAAHDNSIFAWGTKNNLETKLGHRVWVNGNIVEDVWASAQTGYLINPTVRACSGGTICGIYDSVTGEPRTAVDNLRFENNWLRNAPQVFQISTRSLGAGNGGGISQPITNLDLINNLFSNVGDDAQFGAPGSDIAQWAASGQTFLATMTRTANIAHAVVRPLNLQNLDPCTSNVGTVPHAFDVTTVSRASSTVTIKMGTQRHDPKVGGAVVLTVQDWCANTNFSATQIKPTVGNTGGWIFSTGANASAVKTNNGAAPNWNTCTTTCLDGGITWTRTVNTSLGVEGTFAIAAVTNTNVATLCTTVNNTQPQPCIVADGTFGDAFTYTDGRGNLDLCLTEANCDASGVAMTFDTLGFKMTDLQLGDPVYVHNCSGTGNATLYEVGALASVLTSAGTTPTGLNVFYPNAAVGGGNNPDDGSGAVTCQLENSSGLPKNTTFTNNTILSPDIMSIGSNGIAGQHYANRFLHNIFALAAGNNAVLTDSDIGGQGTAVFAAFDPGSFQWADNVMPLRNSAQWSEYPALLGTHCTPGIDCFPPSIGCSASTVAASSTRCMGFAGFMSGNAFPSACAAANAPYNCRMMALPWSTNFSLADVTPVADSPYKLQGADVAKIQAALTSTRRVCPTGAFCGITGPYFDFAHYGAVTWLASPSQGVGGCCTYNLYRSTTVGVLGSLIKGLISGTSYVDRDRSQGTTYYYTLRATDGTNESANTAQIIAMVP